MDKVLVSISGSGTTQSFELDKIPGTISGVTNYSDGGTIVSVPKKNSGLTYIYDMFHIK